MTTDRLNECTDQTFQIVILLIESAEDPMAIFRVGTDSEGVGKVVRTPVQESKVTNTWRRAFIATSSAGQ